MDVITIQKWIVSCIITIPHYGRHHELDVVANIYHTIRTNSFTRVHVLVFLSSSVYPGLDIYEQLGECRAEDNYTSGAFVPCSQFKRSPIYSFTLVSMYVSFWLFYLCFLSCYLYCSKALTEIKTSAEYLYSKRPEYFFHRCMFSTTLILIFMLQQCDL